MRIGAKGNRSTSNSIGSVNPVKLTLAPGSYYGDLLKSCDISGWKFTEIVYPPKHRTLEHSHERAYFSLMLQGAYNKTIGTRKVKCTRQTVVFHPPNQEQSGHCDEDGGRSFVVEIKSKLWDRLCNHSLKVPGVIVSRGGSLTWLASKLYYEYRHMDELSTLAIEGIVLEMMAEVSRSISRVRDRNPPDWLRRARQIVRARFMENLRVTSVAQMVGVHPVHLAAEFRRFYGSTIGEYIRRIRVDFACIQLSTTKTPLVEIALASGFCDHSHFSTNFKRLTGISPIAYRGSFF
jgi:AraC family transcriptional regulator